MTNEKILQNINIKRDAITVLENQINGIRQEIRGLKEQIQTEFKLGDVIAWDENGKIIRVRLMRLNISDTGRIEGGSGAVLRKNGSDGRIKRLYSWDLNKARVEPR